MTDIRNNNKSLFDAFLYICVLLSGLVPRYITTFKLHIVIGISMFTIAVIITWVLFVRRLKVYKSLECSFFFIWFIWIVCSIWRAERIGVWALYLDWIITAILFMQILYYRSSQKTFDIVSIAIVDASFIQILIGLYEITFHRYIFETGNISRLAYGNVAISMFFNANDYATFIVTIMPFAIYLLFKRIGLFYKIYYSFITVASIILVLRSGSRASVLGLLLIVGTLLFLFFRKSQRNIFIGICTLFIVGAALVASSRLRQIITSTFMDIIRDQSGVSNNYRINLIKNGLYFLKETFGFGVGTGNLVNWLEYKAVYPIGQLQLMHNWYVEIAVTFGLLFFVIYMILHVRIIIKLIKSFSMNEGFWTLNNTILVSFISFSLVSISSSSNFYSEWVWMYLVFISSYVLFQSKRNSSLKIEDTKVNKGIENES